VTRLMTTPDWLARHDGDLRLAPDGHTWLVIFDGAPQYKVTPMPAGGRYGCIVLQSVNGKRLDKGQTYASADEAIRGGLEELRSYLGW
jgi:hypothetical protein